MSLLAILDFPPNRGTKEDGIFICTSGQSSSPDHDLILFRQI
jgi:hypothetical protein